MLMTDIGLHVGLPEIGTENPYQKKKHSVHKLHVLLCVCLLYRFELYVFVLFCLYSMHHLGLLLIDYGQPALMSKLTFLAARHYQSINQSMVY